MSDTTANVHLIGGWVFATSKQGYGVTPTLTQSRVSWSADSCMDHPEPARGTFLAHVPRRVAEVLPIDLGSSVRAFVNCWGMDPNGTGSQAYTACAYLEGYVDQVTKTRLKYKGPNRAAARRPYHAVPVQYRLTNAPAAGLTVELFNRRAKTATLTTTSWGGAGGGGQRMVATNRTGAAQTLTFEAMFDVTMGTERTADSTGASGTAAPGTFALDVTHKYQANEPKITYGGTTWTSRGTATITSAPSTITVSYSLQLSIDETVELVPSLAQVTPLPQYGDLIELNVEASDGLAKLGRIYVGDEPWYVVTAETRLRDQLRPAVAKAGMDVDVYPYRDHMGYEAGAADLMSVKVTKLDVDNRSALEVYRRTVAAAGRVALGLSNRVGMSWALKPALKVTVVGGVAQLGEDQGYMSNAATNSVRDVPLRLSTDRMANRITFKYFIPKSGATPPYGETTESITDATSAAKYGGVARTISSDLWAATGTYGDTPTNVLSAGPNLWSKAQVALDAQREPVYYMDADTIIVPRDIDTVIGLAELVDNSQRYGRLVKLDGPIPPEVSPYQRQRGGSFGFGGDGRWHLEMQVEPSDYSGVEAGRYRDISSKSALTFNAFKTTTIRLIDIRNAAL